MKGFKRVVVLIEIAAFVVLALGANTFADASGLKVKEGEVAPDFTLSDQSGEAVRLAAFRGQWVVLYFYPKDDTPGCTKEACSFRDNMVSIQQLDAKVLGVSVDSVASHKKFAEKHHLNFQILSDDRHVVTSAYGALTSFMGMKLARRSTVIIDPEGVIQKLFSSVDPEDHALEIHKTLVALKRK